MVFTNADAVVVLYVLDTWATLNLMHQDASTGLRINPLAPAHKSMGLRDAGGHTHRINCTPVITICNADELARVPFLVVERPSTDMILGYDYICKHVDAIHTKKGVWYMTNYSSVQIY